MPAGQATFNALLPVETGADQVVTATATDPAGNTSEFSLVRRSNATPFLDSNDLSLTADPDVGLTFGATTTDDGVAHLTGQFADPAAANAYTAVIDWGDGQTTPLTVGPPAAGVRHFAADHTYPADVDIAFEPHVRLALTATTEGSPVRLAGQFTDPDAADGHTVTVAWGDGTTSTVTDTPRDPVTDLLSFVATHTLHG